MSVNEWLERQGSDNILDAVLSSPSLFLLSLGALTVIVAVVFRTGVWPALTVIFGASLFVAGVIARVVRMWSRRKST